MNESIKSKFKINTIKNRSSKDSTWYKDNYHHVIVQRNILFVFFAITFAAVIITIFMLVFLHKLKTIEPFVIEIEPKTGIVTVVDQKTTKNFTANEAVDRYFLVKYLRLREIFDNDNYKYNYYTELRLFSSPSVFNNFLAFIRVSNPESPINIYANNPVVSGDLKIRSLQYIESNLVQIRYSVKIKTKRSDRYENINEKSYIASIRFAYNDIQINEDERYINPLGFQILSWKRTEEYI